MIRLALATLIGFIAGELYYRSRAVRAACRLYYVLKLNAVTREIGDTSEDILDAIENGDAEGEENLTNFYVLLSNERDQLRVQLAELSNP